MLKLSNVKIKKIEEEEIFLQYNFIFDNCK
jgi:hypothetical protein